jgi:hypothetical protein
MVCLRATRSGHSRSAKISSGTPGSPGPGSDRMPWSNRHLAARAFLLCLSANPVKLKLARKTAPIGLWSWAGQVKSFQSPVGSAMEIDVCVNVIVICEAI